jgi:hypothetical protein
MSKRLFAWLLLSGVLLPSPVKSRPALSFDSLNQSVIATGLDRSLVAAFEKAADDQFRRRVFGVFLGDARTPLLGDYSIVDGCAIRFAPRLPFLPGRSYRVLLDLAKLSETDRKAPPGRPEKITLAFSTDAPPRPAKARVVRVSPSAESAPANLLRLYIYFSHPMSRRGVSRHVRLLQADGEPVEDAFVETPDELWDPEAHRLTLLFHPGRIKRGVELHDRMGPALQPGNRYRLVVDKGGEDQDGAPLVEDFVMEFRAAPDDRRSPRTQDWVIRAPAAGHKAPLLVTADEPLDEPLFLRCLRVEDNAGRPVPGDALVLPGNVRWKFTPREAWRAGSYVLRVAGEMEDLAGNRPTRLFEEPASSDGRRAEALESVLTFTITARP